MDILTCPVSICSSTNEYSTASSMSDPYGDIDFEEIIEVTGLANDEIKCLKVRKLEINKRILLLIKTVIISANDKHFYLVCSYSKSFQKNEQYFSINIIQFDPKRL